MTPLLTTTELQDILARHVLWLECDPNGSRADLSGADLSGTDLSGTDLSGANLIGANISWRTPLYADTKRKYVLYVLPECSEPMFIAGCRCFTEAEARAHWGAESERAQPEYIAAIDRWKASQ